MANLERRVENLEERHGVRQAPKQITFIDFVPGGELLGLRWHGHVIRRRPAESEEALAERAKAFVLENTTSQWGELIFAERAPSPGACRKM